MRRRHNRRRKNNQRKIIVFSLVGLLFIMAVGYSAFQTNLNINVKGTIKDLQAEVDSKVPTNDLLFWGQANNEDNTSTIFKDKSESNNDGILNGFDNTSSSGYNNGELIFDGVNDYVNIGLANYDFQNSISYVAYVKVYSYGTLYPKIFSNQEGSGSALGINTSTHKLFLQIYDGSKYADAYSNTLIELDQYYTIIGTYDGTNVLVYINGVLEGAINSSKLTVSTMPMFIGANPDPNGNHIEFENMSLKEALVYDRALTEDEVKTITEGFEKKYN